MIDFNNTFKKQNITKQKIRNILMPLKIENQEFNSIQMKNYKLENIILVRIENGVMILTINCKRRPNNGSNGHEFIYFLNNIQLMKTFYLTFVNTFKHITVFGNLYLNKTCFNKTQSNNNNSTRKRIKPAINDDERKVINLRRDEDLKESLDFSAVSLTTDNLVSTDVEVSSLITNVTSHKTYLRGTNNNHERNSPTFKKYINMELTSSHLNMMKNKEGSKKQNNILNKIRTLISTKSEKTVLKNIFDKNRKERSEKYDSKEDVIKTYLTKKSPRPRFKGFISLRKSTPSKHLINVLLRECRKVRLTIRKAKQEYASRIEIINKCYKTVTSSSIIATITKKTIKDIEYSRSNEDQEDTLYGLEDTLATIYETATLKPSSSVSISLYITASNNANHKSLSENTLISEKTLIQTKPLTNYKVKPAFISAYEKHFPMVHILSTNGIKKSAINPINCQSNNNNSTDNKVNAHKYFRHAQQLLSNNSSQMESIVFGKEGEKPFSSKTSTIKPFKQGTLSETAEDLSFLQNKLNSKITLVQLSGINDEVKSRDLPFDKILEDDMNKEETMMIMTHNEERKNTNIGKSLKEFHERKQRERIESQAHDYQTISSHFKQLKIENRNEITRPKVMHSPERIKNVQVNTISALKQSEILKIPTKISEINDFHSSDESSASTSNNNNENNQCSNNAKTKTVSFDDDIRGTYIQPNNEAQWLQQSDISYNGVNHPENEVQGPAMKPNNETQWLWQNNISYDRVSHLENEVQGLGVMLNNVIRRMNNLELNFQEFTTLFIKLHKETLDVQANFSAQSYCYRCMK